MALTTKQRERAARYITRRMREHGIADHRELAGVSGVDVDTAQSFLAAERWPQTETRRKIEKALDLPLGRIQDAATMALDDEPEQDQVEAAIYRSQLTRANQLKLAGIYYEMLESQQRQAADTA